MSVGQSPVDSRLVTRYYLVRVLPGKFSNMVRVLMVGFHDVLVENPLNTPDYHVRLVTLCLLICISIGLTWRHCTVTVNGSSTPSLVVVLPGLVPTAGFMLFQTCPGMLWTITWRWVSYGGARSSGVRFGRGRPGLYGSPACLAPRRFIGGT